MAGCDVCIGGFDGDTCEFSHTQVRKARKVHECSECREAINKGEQYQHACPENAARRW